MNVLLKLAFLINGVSLTLSIVMLCMWSLSSYEPMMNFIYAVAALTGAGLLLTLIGILLAIQQKKKMEEAAEKVLAMKHNSLPAQLPTQGTPTAPARGPVLQQAPAPGKQGMNMYPPTMQYASPRPARPPQPYTMSQAQRQMPYYPPTRPTNIPPPSQPIPIPRAPSQYGYSY